ncbi:MAG: Uma2 family endonuclease [Caldilineaceae bacterium]
MTVRRNSLAEDSELTWDIARLFPYQGEWTEEEYLALDTNHLIEFTNGYLEFLPMPTSSHQFIVFFLYRHLWTFVTERKLGEVLAAPLPVRIGTHKFREPDVFFMDSGHDNRRGEAYWRGADLVMEVISSDDPDRDYKTKKREYAEAGIPEYWIIDPLQQMITVFNLDGETYRAHGVFIPSTRATSVLLEGFVVDVAEVFAAAK